MHLLATQSGTVGGDLSAIDLGQEPGDIAILSAADTELACLARAYDLWEGAKPTLRLANFLHLQHPYSVDLYVQRTLASAKLIILRLLGGRPYWPYGVDAIEALARENGIGLAVLPGGDEPDPALLRHCTIPPLDVERLRCYLAHGGIANAVGALRLAAHLLGVGELPEEPRPLPRAGLYRSPSGSGPVAAIVFYRALIESGFTGPVDALAEELGRRGLEPLGIYVSSLKDPQSASVVREAFAAHPPHVILNATGFAIGVADGDPAANPYHSARCPVLQVMFSGSSRAAWEASAHGLSARDLAMNVVLPELDGRIITRALSFKSEGTWHEPTRSRIVTYEPDRGRIGFTAELAARWAKLRRTPPSQKRIAIVLANYPNRDGRIGNGVGYDTPRSTIAILNALAGSGYRVEGIPASGNALLADLLAGPTNADGRRKSRIRLSRARYCAMLAALPARVRAEVSARWGEPHDDPFFSDDAFELPVRLYGNIAIAIQPARGYNIHPKASYHDPALVPPHGYFAFQFWLREEFAADAVIHNGKHGNLEWLPGKAAALSADCYPEAALGPLPLLYPFIVNDPGEGSQAKRRTGAVIIDHLTPPLARAEAHGPALELEALVDEYYAAHGVDRRRTKALRDRILDVVRSSRLDLDAGIADDDSDAALRRLDAYLCDLKEAQIRDGLHVLGEAPQGMLETNFLAALVRVPRRLGEGGDQSLPRALAADLELRDFDPLDCDLAAPWNGPRPAVLARLSAAPWRTRGDTVERLELLAVALIETGEAPPGRQSGVVLDTLVATIRPALRSCGSSEIDNLLLGLDGRFVAPGPSGAPTRGRLDVLPTGRNFYSLDNRAVPTPTAWTLGEKSAAALLTRHFQDHGAYPKALGLSVWGTANMRTGGDDIAQALALIGAKPVWEPSSWRVTGFDIVPLAALGRPRVDVTLRISGFFRDAFPLQIELYDKAVRAVGALEEPPDDNPIAARMAEEAHTFEARGSTPEDAHRLAGQRVFGSKPGAYGAGLQALIDEKLWAERADLARAYVVWGSYSYGAAEHGAPASDSFLRRLGRIEAVVHNQDNREHDVLDSDDYYQFEGGMTAAVEQASGKLPRVYHNDHSRPERPLVRTLEEEIGRVVRSRVVNPKWIAGVMRHGYKGAFEIAATVDYLFAFAATTGAAKTHHFDLAYEAFVADDAVREFLAANNPAALHEIAARFAEAAARGLWTPRSNSAYNELDQLTRTHERQGRSVHA